MPGERDMMSRLQLPGYPEVSRWVRAMPVAPQQGLQPALSVAILAGHTAGNFSLVGPELCFHQSSKHDKNNEKLMELMNN